MILYKYLPPIRTDVLEDQCLRVTPANNQNDIFEMRPYFENIVDNSQKDELLSDIDIDINQYIDDNYDALPIETKNQFDKDTLKIIFEKTLETKFGKKLIEQSKEYAFNFLNENKSIIQKTLYNTNIQLTGIISLSEKYNSNKMWAHYGDSHRGFIIGFNSNHYFFNKPRSDDDEYFRIRKVVYDNSNKIKTLYGIDGADLLLRKSIDWEYEMEWRLLIPLFLSNETINKNGETIHLVKFPTDCIESIVFGIKSNNELKELIYKIIENKRLRRVKIGQMYVANNEPKINVNWIK